MRPTGIRRAAIVGVTLLAATTLASPLLAGRAADVRTEAASLLNKGVSAYNRGLYPESVEHLRGCAAVALNSFRAHHYLGLALIATRDYAEAVEALAIALDLDDTHLDTLVALGDAYLKLGDATGARAAYFRAMKLRPAYAPALDGLARAFESQSRDDDAIDHYRQAIATNKGFAPAYTHLGNLFLRHNRLGEAVRLMEEAVTIRPDFAMGFNRLAVAYGRLSMTNEGVAEVRKAIELDPSNPHHPQTLGWLQLSQGLLDAATTSFRQALELDVRMPGSHRGLADVARRRGHYERALEHVDTALAIDRLPTMTSRNLLELREEIEQERQHFAELESLVASGEASPEDYGALARIFAGRGLWERAAELQRNAPPSMQQEELLAFLLFKNGQYREAHGIYQALAERFGLVSLRLNDGVALSLLGDDEAAARSFREVLESEPEHALARLYLGNAFLRMGDARQAAKSYRAYLDLGGETESSERVRRILKQIAPDLLPILSDPLVPDERPPVPPDVDEEAATS